MSRKKEQPGVISSFESITYQALRKGVQEKTPGVGQDKAHKSFLGVAPGRTQHLPSMDSCYVPGTRDATDAVSS